MCWWRGMEISWTNCVTNEETLHRVREKRNILHTLKRRKANWLGTIFQSNCILKPVIKVKVEGRIEVTVRWGRRCKQLLNDLKEMRWCWKLKVEALDCTVWRTGFVGGYGPVIRQTNKQKNEWWCSIKSLEAVIINNSSVSVIVTVCCSLMYWTLCHQML